MERALLKLQESYSKLYNKDGIKYRYFDGEYKNTIWCNVCQIELNSKDKIPVGVVQCKCGSTFYIKNEYYCDRPDGSACIQYCDGVNYFSKIQIEIIDNKKQNIFYMVNAKYRTSDYFKINHKSKTKYYGCEEKFYVLFNNGKKIYYNSDNVIHRDDGPAIIYPNGQEYYYLNGKQLSEEQYMKNK